MKILLFGPNGQVGSELQSVLAPLGQVVALDRDGNSGLCGDLSEPKSIAAAIRTVQPDVIVNAAAYTAVDRAESESEQAWQINAVAPRIMAELAREQNALLIHYSTDYVFDGSGERPWREDNRPSPLNVYGETKLAGENAIRDAACSYLIFRTSWVYATRGQNFIRTMLRLARERESLQVIDDQHGAPTGAALIARITAQAVRIAARRPDEYTGVYHLTAAGETSWYGYARFVIEQARAAGWSLRVADDAIEAVASDAFTAPARRPHNSRLDGRKLEAAFDLKRPGWKDGVAQALADMGSTPGGGS